MKQLLKRFFSEQPWTEADDEALADAVAVPPGAPARAELAPDLTLTWSWPSGRFRLRLVGPAGPPPRPPGWPDEADPDAHADADPEADLERLFSGSVVPEVTPSPRTIRFATPALGAGPSRAYDAAGADADPRVAAVFGATDDVTDVLVGPDFVAVTIVHPDRWEQLLAPVLDAVARGFTGAAGDAAPPPAAVLTLDAGRADEEVPARRLDRAWAELGALRGDRGEDLDRILAATRDPEPARRQVAAALLVDADGGIAAGAWSRLAADPSRAVRRATLDAVAGAVADTDRQDLRPILEHALADADAWVRWKALRGIVALGLAPSRAAVEALAADPDFRVRLEATRALR